MERLLSSISAYEDVSDRTMECLQLWSGALASWEAHEYSPTERVNECLMLVAIRPHMKVYPQLFPGTLLFLCSSIPFTFIHPCILFPSIPNAHDTSAG